MTASKFLFFLERDFHIAMLQPLMMYIDAEKLGEMRIYAPFHEQINKLLRENLPFMIETTRDPWSWGPDITFMADFSYQYVEGLGKVVNIGHGTICKGWFFSKNKISQRENCADLICVPGEIHKERLQSQVYKHIIVTGMPKLDDCFNNSLKKDELYLKFGLNPEQKTVLLAPTFNDEFSILPYLQGIDLGKIFPEYINLIVKLHGVTEDSVKQLFYSLKSDTRNVYISDSYASAEVFYVADILVSDVSSVIYEFLALEKPVLLFDSPNQKTYINYDESDLEWEFRDVGFRFDAVEKLPSLIFKALTSNQSFLFQNISDRFIGVKDGTSTAKVIKAALNLVDFRQETELTILTNKDSDDLSKRFGSQYPIKILKTDNTLQGIVEIVDRIKTKYIAYLDADCDFSPQIVTLLLNQIKQNNKAGMVVPMILDNQIHLQQARFRVNIADTNFYQTAIKLSYSFIGQSAEVDYALTNCFITYKSFFMNRYFTDIQNEKLSTLELLTHIAQNGFKVLLAYDCLVNRKEKEVVPLQEETFGYEEALQKELDSISELTEEELKEKIYENPFNETIIIKLIQHYYNKEQWEQIDIYADMLKGNPKAIYYGAKSLENQDFTEEALARLEQIDLDTIYDNELLLNCLQTKAKLLLKLQRTENVLAVLEKALEVNSHNPETILTRAVYYFSQGSTAEASADFDTILAANPHHIKALQGKATIAQIEDRLEESSVYFVKILQLDEENLEAINGLLKNSYALKDYVELEKALEMYLSYHPANLEILFTLAGVCAEMQNYIKSNELLERITIFEPNYVGIKELLGKITPFLPLTPEKSIRRKLTLPKKK
ncbi:MAG: CDP-glycerol glycerophosphotransferase family protein [Candidatus Cloacimonetes bacterium]|nr:CDP-glycerol glycerophosphotransferase family protein [Candidatus Cloacimonadota bacterium]